MSTSSGCFPTVLCLCDLDRGIESAGGPYDSPAGCLAAGAETRRRQREVEEEALRFPMGLWWMDVRREHQGLNLFSHFCFPKRFPAEFVLCRDRGRLIQTDKNKL